MSGVTLPASITDRLLAAMNPLADLNVDFTLPAPITITQVTLADGSLQLDAVLNFPQPN